MRVKLFDKSQYIPLVLLILLVFVGSWLRLANLTRTSLWFDEYLTFDEAMRPTISETIAVTASHPPLQRLLIRFSSALFGKPDTPGGHDLAVRLPSTVAGILAIFFLYLFATTASSSAFVGLLAAAFWALGPYGIYYSQEARFYSAMVLFSAWTLHAVLWFRDRPDSIGRGIYLTIPLLLGAYNHALFGFIFILSFLAVLPAILKGFKTQWHLALPWVISGLLFLPWFLYAVGRLESQARPWIPNVLTQFRDIPVALFTGRIGLFHLEHLNEDVLGRNSFCFWVLVFIIYAARQRGKKNAVLLLSIPIIVLVTTIILHEASITMRYFHHKYLAFLYPFVCLWFGEALYWVFDICHLQQFQSWWNSHPRPRLPIPTLKWGLVSITLLWLLWTLTPAIFQAHERMWPGSGEEFHKEQYREAVAWIEAHRESSPVYVFEHHWEDLSFGLDLTTRILRYYGAKEPLYPIILEDVQTGHTTATNISQADKRAIYVAIHTSLENAEIIGALIRTRYPVVESEVVFPGCEGPSCIWVYSRR